MDRICSVVHLRVPVGDESRARGAAGARRSSSLSRRSKRTQVAPDFVSQPVWPAKNPDGPQREDVTDNVLPPLAREGAIGGTVALELELARKRVGLRPVVPVHRKDNRRLADVVIVDRDF